MDRVDFRGPPFKTIDFRKEGFGPQIGVLFHRVAIVDALTTCADQAWQTIATEVNGSLGLALEAMAIFMHEKRIIDHRSDSAVA